MKRLLVGLLVLGMLSMVGCGDKAVDQAEETKNPAQETVQSEVSNNENGEDTIKEASANTISDMELGELSEEQIDIFKSVAHEFIDNVLNGEMTVAEMVDSQLFILDTYIMANELPANGRELFNEWKESVDYYGKLAEWLMNNGLTAEVETIKPQVSEKDSDTREEHKADTVVQQTNKPKPSEKQEQTQKQEVTSKPIKPSNNTPKEEVVGTPGDVVSAGGGNGDNFTKAEDVIGDFDDLMASAIKSEANRIAKEKGISYEEALKLVQSGN